MWLPVFQKNNLEKRRNQNDFEYTNTSQEVPPPPKKRRESLTFFRFPVFRVVEWTVEDCSPTNKNECPTKVIITS